jgi:Zn-dependent protease with chaperone function
MMIDSLSYLLISSLLVGFAACTGMAVLQYPLVRWMSRTRSTCLSSDFWFAWGILPILMGTFLGGFVLAFDWVGSSGWLSNPHTQSSPQGGLFFWGAALGCFAVVVTAALRTYRRYLPAHRLLGGVFPEKTANGPSVSFSLLPSGFPVAFTAGLFFPRVYLSKAATELLTAQERDIVLSHESEHIRRRDPLRLLLLTFCEYWLPGVWHIRQQWQEKVEMECDQASVKLGFAADRVASTILKFEKAKATGCSPAMSLAYAPQNNSDLKARIESLFDNTPRAIGQRPVLLGCAALCLLLTVNFMEVHRGVKVFLGWLN